MQIKCEFCGAFINDTDTVCPNCGGTNDQLKRSTEGTPKTIEELKAWYTDRNLPPQEVTRFFIGVDYKEPRAFGIYQDGNEFVVYKNKDNGQRAVRYRGKDEAYAVNELFLKLKSEILNQKAHNINGSRQTRSSGDTGKRGRIGVSAFIVVWICSVTMGVFSSCWGNRNRGYYSYNGDCYYCESYSNNEWYIYDSYTRDYLPVTAPSQLYDNIADYRYDEQEAWQNGITAFEDTSTGREVIDSRSSSSSSSDSDYDWSSSDSWDSGSTDWGSDW